MRVVAAVAAIVIVAAGAWLWATAGRESTDDAQVESNVTPIAARVGGTVIGVAVKDNQKVDAGAVLVELDPRDFDVRIEQARADLAAAEAAAQAARVDVPIASTTTTSNVTTARGGVAQAKAGVGEAQAGVEAARARLTTAQAHLRET